MEEVSVVPELKTILGAIIFGAERPLKIAEMRKCVVAVAEEQKGPLAPFAEVREADVAAAVQELAVDLQRVRAGFVLREVAGGFRLESDPACGAWLRHLLDLGKPSRLSRPALETLAIIAYRQPVTKITIEGIRGVTIDHILKLLMEMQLVRIVGRSDLPGRPFLYGTTQTFLEQFGLRSLDELGDLEPMLRREMIEADKNEHATGPAAAAAEPPGATPGAEAPPEIAEAAEGEQAHDAGPAQAKD
jgi:segregation and condensation protein B